MCTVFNDGIWKGNNFFLLVFYGYFTSIMHRFRDNDVFLQTRNDVMVIPPLGRTVPSFRRRILKGDPKFTFMLYWHILPIFNRLRVIRPFHFGWDFPSADQICGVFGENDPQKVKISKRTCLESASSRQTASFELSCVAVGSQVWAVRGARNEKQKINNNNRHATLIFHRYMRAPPLMRSQSNSAGLLIRVTQLPLPNLKTNDS